MGRPRINDEFCTIEGCGLLVLARNLCSKHYNRRWRNSDENKALRRSGRGVVGCGLCGQPLNRHSVVMGCP